MKAKIGSALIHRPQRYATQDPAPHVPFANDIPAGPDWFAWFVLVAALLIVVFLTRMS